MFLSKKPSGIYYIVYTKPNGKRSSISTGETRKPEATQKLLKFNKRLEFIEEHKINPITLRDYYWEFLKYSESVHTEKTLAGQKTTRLYLLNHFDGDMQLKDLTKKDIYEYLLKRKNESSIYAARKDQINLSSALTKAVIVIRNNHINMLV